MLLLIYTRCRISMVVYGVSFQLLQDMNDRIWYSVPFIGCDNFMTQIIMQSIPWRSISLIITDCTFTVKRKWRGLWGIICYIICVRSYVWFVDQHSFVPVFIQDYRKTRSLLEYPGQEMFILELMVWSFYKHIPPPPLHKTTVLNTKELKN